MAKFPQRIECYVSEQMHKDLLRAAAILYPHARGSLQELVRVALQYYLDTLDY